MTRPLFASLLLVWSLSVVTVALANDAGGFEPARAPSKGPHDAPVTIIEIADYM